VPHSDGGVLLCGDNTDWLGIYWPISQRFRRRRGVSAGSGPFLKRNQQSLRVALILGAGGTAMAAAYAAQRLGLVPLFYNRTLKKAEDLASRFFGSAAVSLESADDIRVLLAGRLLGADAAWTISAVISTLPPAVHCTIPTWVLMQQPVVLDVAYGSAMTPLLSAAAASGCDTISGAEMLCTQGLFAFGVWTGRSACCSTGENEHDLPPGLPAHVPSSEMVRAVIGSLASRGS
jgi:pentafunctional AROM polypeptide